MDSRCCPCAPAEPLREVLPAAGEGLPAEAASGAAPAGAEGPSEPVQGSRSVVSHAEVLVTAAHALRRGACLTSSCKWDGSVLRTVPQACNAFAGPTLPTGPTMQLHKQRKAGLLGHQSSGARTLHKVLNVKSSMSQRARKFCNTVCWQRGLSASK
jgi:hypothetical protein